MRRGEWKGWAFDFMLGIELRGKQLGLIGAWPHRPRRRRACARRSACASPTRRVDRRHAGAEQMSFDRLLNTSDVVSLHVPLTPETRHLIDKRAWRA